jgi:hypothetical protein
MEVLGCMLAVGLGMGLFLLLYTAIGYLSMDFNTMVNRDLLVTIMIFSLFYLLPMILCNYGMIGYGVLFAFALFPVFLFVAVALYRT